MVLKLAFGLPLDLGPKAGLWSTIALPMGKKSKLWTMDVELPADQKSWLFGRSFKVSSSKGFRKLGIKYSKMGGKNHSDS
jgi:hypothetical protein